MERVHEESDAHEESSNSGQEHDLEVFFQPSQAQAVQTCSFPT